MSDRPAPSLEGLQDTATPAWLWDGARARIVWANRAGLAAFGTDSLFDLVDRAFDRGEPGVARIGELTGHLRPGEASGEILAFPSSHLAEPVRCRCFGHTLGDGRIGLLVVADAQADAGASPAPETLAEITDALPVALVAIDRDGRVTYANPQARELVPAARRATLGELVGDDMAATRLMARGLSAGTVSETRAVETRFGRRELRLDLRRLGGQWDEPGFLVLMEDVSDRRSLERRLSANVERLTDFVAAAADFTFELDSDLRLIDISAGIEVVTGLGLDDLKGLDWATLAGRYRLDEDGRIAAALETGEAWRAVVRWETADAQIPVCLSAVPVTAAGGALAGWRGIGARATARPQPVPPAGGGTGHTNVRELEIRPGDRPADKSETPPSNGDRSAHNDNGHPAREPPRRALSPEDAAVFAAIGKTLSSADKAAAAAQSGASESQAMPERNDAEAVSEPAPPATEGTAWAAGDRALRAILETATDGIVTLDADGLVLSFNAGAQALFGRNAAEVIGRPFAELLTPDSRETLSSYLSALTGSGLASVFNDGREVTALERQGGEIPLFMTIAPIAAQTEPGEDGDAALRFCAVMRDITQWKTTEVELRTAKDAAEKASAQKSEFLANISHELRTPLNAILGFSEVMRAERFGPIENARYKGYINDIHVSGAHLLSLINDLLDLSKVEAGKFELNFTAVDLADMVEQGVHIMEDQAREGRVLVRTSRPKRLPTVVADQRSIRQIILNLLSNAIKFTEPGGQVIVSLDMTEEGEVKLKVKDTGVGMTAPELTQALEPFQRVGTSRTREISGTGLGLPLTRALTEANRAAFSISSEPKRGTLVEITFPTTRVLAG